MQQEKLNIGIVTHYYNSTNFGGNLQAYALCRFLNENFPFVKAEQISYDIRQNSRKQHNLSTVSVYRIVKKLRTLAQNKIYAKTKLAEMQSIKIREKAILKFNTQMIPHSAKVYNADTVAQCTANYDVFITGSDQVWHPSAVCPAYLLSFVNGAEKPKISYAASIAKTDLSEEEKNAFKIALLDYKAVSVREEEAVKLLSGLSPVTPKWVLDPTMLLTTAQWDSVAAKRRINAPYLFCYFLGDDIRQRKLAQTFAKEKGLKIVTLPFLLGRYRKCDANFGDELLFDTSVPDFLSLIKFSDYVLTDSFHAAVFSVLYKKEFFVFERAGAKSAGSRIHSLLSLFDMEDRFCNTPEKMQVSYFTKQNSLYQVKSFDKFEKMKALSVRFLKDALCTQSSQSKD